MTMTDRDLIEAGAVVLVNVFTPEPGGFDAFVAAQAAEYERSQGQVPGALGNRLLRAPDGMKAVNIAYLASREAYEAWHASPLFEDHLDRIRHPVEAVEPGLYGSAYDSVAGERS